MQIYSRMISIIFVWFGTISADTIIFILTLILHQMAPLPGIVDWINKAIGTYVVLFYFYLVFFYFPVIYYKNPKRFDSVRVYFGSLVILFYFIFFLVDLVYFKFWFCWILLDFIFFVISSSCYNKSNNYKKKKASIFLVYHSCY